MAYTQGELEPARLEIARALALQHEERDLDVVAQVEHLCGHVAHALGNVETAREVWGSA